MQTILITGVAGFIGSHLAERLINEGNTIVGIDNFDPFYDESVKRQNLAQLSKSDRFHFFQLDIAEKKDLDSIDIPVSAVIHIAAKAGVRPSIQNPQAYIRSNITGTQNILDYMVARSIKKMLFASSSSVYGNDSSAPFTEDQPTVKPISPYAASKRSCELINYSYHHLYGLDILNLRLFTVYGPRQRPDLAIHKFIKKITNGETIDMYGDGSSARDYTFVYDIVDGFIKALNYIESNTNVYDILNLGNSKQVKLKELIEYIGNELGIEPAINRLEMQPGDVNSTYANISKAQNLIGYAPNTSIQEGIHAFAEWFKNNNR